MINWENRHTVRSHLHLESHCFISNTANTVGVGFWAEETPWNQPKSSLTLSFQSAVNPFTNDFVTLNNQDDKKYDEWWKIHRFKGIHSNKVSLRRRLTLMCWSNNFFNYFSCHNDTIYFYLNIAPPRKPKLKATRHNIWMVAQLSEGMDCRIYANQLNSHLALCLNRVFF